MDLKHYIKHKKWLGNYLFIASSSLLKKIKKKRPIKKTQITNNCKFLSLKQLFYTHMILDLEKLHVEELLLLQKKQQHEAEVQLRR